MTVAAACALLCVVPPASAAPPTAAEVAARTRLLELINEFRTGTDLVEDLSIDRIAYHHSKSMARTNTLSHRGFRKRFADITADNANMTALCENVAMASGYPTPRKAANRIFMGWRASKGHRLCMQRAAADTAGIGVERRGGAWWATFIAADDATI